VTPEHEQEYLSRLRPLAPIFDSLDTRRPDATLGYDLFADAVYWSDELPDHASLPFDLDVTLIRPMLRHRTCTMLGLESSFGRCWEIALGLFPSWVGFAPDRVHPAAEVLDSARAMIASGAREVRLLGRLSDRCNRQEEARRSGDRGLGIAFDHGG
jgi:hypothetical protein